MGTATIGKYRDLIISKMVEKEYHRTGLRQAIREVFQKWIDEEWTEYIESGEYQEGDEKFEIEEPQFWPTPTAWKTYKEVDKTGREWIVFECVEPATSKISLNKAIRYGELWFDLDARDELIELRLNLMDEHGQLYGVDLMDMFYTTLKDGCQNDDVERILRDALFRNGALAKSIDSLDSTE